MAKNLPAMQKTWVQSLGREDPLEEGMAVYSSILAWRTSWTEEPGRLQSMRLQRVGHNWATNTFTFHCSLCSSTSKKAEENTLITFIVGKLLCLMGKTKKITNPDVDIYYATCFTFFVYWSTVDLQYCVSFVCAPKWQLYIGLANKLIQIFP